MDAAGTQAILDLLLVDAANDLPAEPDRKAVSHGKPVVEMGVCSQLYVYLTGVTPRPLNSNATAAGCVLVPQGRFAVETWRCAPSSGVPAPGMETVSAASALALADAIAVWNGIVDRRRAGTLLPPGPAVHTALVSMAPLGPSGAMAGWLLLLDVELSRPSVPPAS